jgi:two-component system, NtrC family, nitrogen regulation sensor histidine kinase NtrY
MHKRFSILIIIRITLLVANVLVIAWIFGDVRLFFNQIILGLILIGQVAELIHFVNHTNRELSRLFLAIRHSDFSMSFSHPAMGRSFKELQASLSEIIVAYKNVKIEKEAQYHFLQMLVNQVHVGIISLTGEDVVLINPTAERLLNIQGLKNWRLIKQFNPSLQNEFDQIGESGRKLVEIKSQGETKIISVDISTSVILEKSYKLITLQDINSEIEQKEIEAWHKLIRILTHEIMNSVTPISSLSETMQAMLTDKNGRQKNLSDLNDETISDLRFSINTIQKRSEGLLTFVETYRKLTRIPKPAIEEVNVKSFLQNVESLMTPKLQEQQIKLTLECGEFTHSFDPTLVEQVLINLITNSTHALENRPDKKINIKAFQQENATLIEVEDNGKGIPDKELREIFVPFFSTKKEGSGIGLSLSKQIMSLHGGSIKVQSAQDVGTVFQLHFRNR